MEDFKERREAKRYRSRADQAAYVAIRPTFKRIGAVQDVSRSGLGFIYSLMGDQVPLSDQETVVSIDLFDTNNGFYLPRVKCRLAYDRFRQNQSWEFSSGTQFRQCGLEFDADELTADQKNKLQFFIENYTVAGCEKPEVGSRESDDGKESSRSEEMRTVGNA
jgi:hypothetical protein